MATAGHTVGLEGQGGWESVSRKVQAAAAYYGVSDFTGGAMQSQHHTSKVVIKLFRGTEQEKPELYRKASPIFCVSKDNQPLLVHDEDDDVAPFDQWCEWPRPIGGQVCHDSSFQSCTLVTISNR